MPITLSGRHLVVILLTLAAGCSRADGRTATHAAQAARAQVAPAPAHPAQLPLPSGPLITVDGDHSYSAQGVAAATAQSWKGEAAPTGYSYVLLTVAVVPSADGPPLAAGYTDYDLGIRYPGCGSYCFSSLERAVPYGSRDELRTRAPGTGDADSGQPLEPGTSYYATLHQQIPWNIDLNAVRLCRSGQPDGVCAPLGALPRLETG